MFLWIRRVALHFVINFCALYAAHLWIDGIYFASEDWELIAIASVIFGLANTLIKPFLRFFSVPFIVLTLGLFMFVINGLMLELTAWIIQDFTVESFRVAVKGALLITVVHYSAHWLMRETMKK